METQKKRNMIFQRLRPLLNQLSNREFRQSYLSNHVKVFLASQMRALRGEKSQKEFAEMLGTKQSVVSRYENPDYGQVTLQTLLEVANKLDVALLVRFMTFPEFIEATSDFSREKIAPSKYNHIDMEELQFASAPSSLLDSIVNKSDCTQVKLASQSFSSNRTSQIITLADRAVTVSRQYNQGLPA